MNISWKKAGFLSAAVAVILGIFIPISIQAGKTSSNLSTLKSDYKCTDPSKEYHFYDKTTSHNITIDSSGNKVVVYLENATIDMLADKEKNSKSKPAIRVTKGTHAVIYLVGTNVLEGGNNTKLLNKDGYAGIQVDDGATLTILGNGTLTVKGGGADNGAAGIGGSYDQDCGQIIIGNATNCPVINATGGDGGAGIGGGEESACNDGIYIYNGVITATGVDGGAGIGAGNGVSTGSGGNVDTITISGGTIVANGSSGAAGIGGSDAGTGKGSGDASNITISNGTITATGGSEAAGIGGGRDGLLTNLTIYGGTITAKGGKYGAGIGGGNSVGAGSGGDVKGLYICGGNITATGGEGAAGIGGGDQSIVTDFAIVESTFGKLNLTATGGAGGAGIGNGNVGVEKNDIDLITIELFGGTIKATGGDKGAGIGGGNSAANKIVIKGQGTITATGNKESCGIGSGYKERGGEIIIEGIANTRVLTIYANAFKNNSGDNDAACIGSADSAGESITIRNAMVYIDSVSQCYGSGIGAGKNESLVGSSMKDITIENCYIKDLALGDRRATSIGAGVSSAMGNIVIKNSEVHGGAIGSTDNSNEIFKYNCIGDITIEDSIITAEPAYNTMAAIGSGRYSGVGKITITNSNIVAKSKGGAGIGSAGYSSASVGDAFKWIKCDVTGIYITGSTITATGGDGGAGIGSGWGTEVGEIIILDSQVTATGGYRGTSEYAQGGAGIGAGYCESVGHISIENSIVTATGSRYAAGIGSGGNDSSSTVMWNTSCGGIELVNSTITATGGSGAAGIGTGYGAQFFDSGDIYILDCDVTATGGNGGAGIGAGSNGWAGAGGEAHDITITGESKVTATGGTGAAGIGGGLEGGCDNIEISLLDTKYDSGEWVYYVKAYGGTGAAGIGSGGVNTEGEIFTKTGYDVKGVTISGGYVYGKGGDDKNGAGAAAGIGGGARGGKLKAFNVSGGYVVGQAGYASQSNDKASDIGGGGSDVKLSKDDNFKITGGTVIGNLSSEPKTIIIDGGSVSDNINNAKRSTGTSVYQTRMQLDNPYYEVNNLKCSDAKYLTNDIFSDGNAVVYLYLPATGQDNSYADFEEYHYYGTTSTNGLGWIKRPLELSFKEPQYDAVVGNDFVLKLDDAHISCDIEFTVVGDCVTKTSSIDCAPGAEIRMICEDFGEFQVKAQTKNLNSNMYWDGTAIYNDKITKSKTTISYVQCVSKIYDGEPVSNPSVKTNSDGVITYKFYENDVYLGDGVRPIQCGSYYVVVCVAETDNYAAAQSNKMYFEITKCFVSLEMTATENGDEATVIVEVFDPYEDPGEITLSVSGGNTHTVDVVENNGRYIATHTFDSVVGTNYTVTASYADTRNYRSMGDVTKEFDKGLANRTITVEDITTVYGDNNAPTSFTVTPSEGTVGEVTYEVVYDLDNLNYNFEKTIEVDGNTGEITYYNAGIAYVKVTMSDPDGVYDEAVAYAKVTVTRKPISISSYAYLSDDNTKTPVDTVEYGQLNTLLYGLKYGNSINVPEDFNAIGSLEAIPVNETLGVEDDARISIAQISGEVIVNGVTYETFISRNYLITYVPTTLTITPADLKVTAEEKAGRYGDEPEYTYTFGRVDGSNNLMPWDEPSEVVAEIGLAGGVDYDTLSPGVYEDLIVVTLVDNPNYIVTTKTGGLNVEKGLVKLDVTADSKVYDKLPLEAEVIANAIVPEAASDAVVKEIGNVIIKYYVFNEDDTVTELSEEPVNVGSYFVKTTVIENEYYQGVENITYFRILKARYDVDTPKLNDIYMKDGLVISEQQLPEGWVWYNPDKALEIGKQYGFAIFTPEDSQNYYKVIRKIDFNVLDKDAQDDNKVDVDTGAEYKIINLSIIMLVSLTLVMCNLFKKKKELTD